MGTIAKHDFADLFKGRVVRGPYQSFGEQIKQQKGIVVYDLRSEYVSLAYCATKEIADTLLIRRTQTEVLSERNLRPYYNTLDLSEISIGKSFAMDKVYNKTPMWSELRPWLEDMLDGLVSVYIDSAMTWMSFEHDHDYALAKLMFG